MHLGLPPTRLPCVTHFRFVFLTSVSHVHVRNQTLTTGQNKFSLWLSLCHSEAAKKGCACCLLAKNEPVTVHLEKRLVTGCNCCYLLSVSAALDIICPLLHLPVIGNQPRASWTVLTRTGPTLCLIGYQPLLVINLTHESFSFPFPLKFSGRTLTFCHDNSNNDNSS